MSYGLRFHSEQTQSCDEKERHEKDGQYRGGKHAPNGACPNRILTTGTGARKFGCLCWLRLDPNANLALQDGKTTAIMFDQYAICLTFPPWAIHQRAPSRPKVRP